MPTYGERRAMLAAMAARLAVAGQGQQAVWAPLARLTAAELLCPAVPGSVDMPAELEAVYTAAAQAVRRRPGWLCADVPGLSLPVLARPRLVQAAVLCVLAGALHSGSSALLRCTAVPGAALLVLRGGRKDSVGPAPALLRRLAAEGGGTVIFTAGEDFAAALRLPLAGGQPKPARTAADLLADRYSVLYQFLGPFCAGPF